MSSQENLNDYFTEFKSKETSKRRNLECEDTNQSAQPARINSRMLRLAAAFIIGVISLPLLKESLHAKQGDSPSVKQHEAPVGQLEFTSSDPAIVTAFTWARRQALAYAFKGDPVGEWYEAALPGREAFCMRDVSHQAMGAHALGLAAYTRNMLKKFVENISESKDWCSYWEINRFGLPAPVDYRNDGEFWYNLPANLDVLDAAYRMYTWTGDRTYITDPAFLNFYRRTVHDYVDRWDLAPDRIMARQRILNIRGRLDPTHRFQTNRGIPSYDEGDKDFVVAIDQVVVEYAGYLAYAHFAQLLGEEDEAKEFLKRAEEMKALLNQDWWDAATNSYYSKLDLDHKLTGHGLNTSVLYYGGAEDGPKSESVVNGILQGIADKHSMGVEGQSHLPEILYRYGKADAAYDQIIDITSEGKNRREYPEVSYSVVGAIMTGLMGIELQSSEPGRALQESMYVDRILTTLSRLTQRTKWAQAEYLPVRRNEIAVRHDGAARTTLWNNSGPSFRWRACFQGSHAKLWINGKTIAARTITFPPSGQPVSCAIVDVGAGERKVVQIAD